MHAIMLLATSAQADPNGTMHALGLGWTQIATPLGQTAVVVFLSLEPHEQTTTHHLSVDLLDADGYPVHLGENQETGLTGPLRIDGQVDIHHTGPLVAGIEVSQALAFNIAAGIPLDAGHRYEWRLSVDNTTLASRGFTVTA